jgi:electron transfer flavoprotein beta subunit
MAGGDGIRVLVCVKRVPAPGARIALTPDGRDIDTRNLGFTTSPHEECAVEEAIRLVEAHGGTTTVLTVGPPAADEQLRYALSVGAGAAVLVTTDGPDPDAQATARALVRAIGALEVEDGPFDLVLFGNESADAGGFQVGIRVARALGRPVVNGVKGLAVDSDAVLARREATDGLEVYRLSLPAVVGVKEGINLPRYPTLPGRLRSKKAEVAEQAAEGEPGGLRTVAFALPVEQVTETTILGTGPEAAPAVVDLLVELGLA